MDLRDRRKVAPQAATDGHAVHVPFLIRLAGPASPAKFFYLLCDTTKARQKFETSSTEKHAAGEAGLRA
jgi:hypothetical protein